MNFIKTTDTTTGIADLAKRLIDELTAGKHVLWLVPGGSNIAAVVEIMKEIPTPLSNLLSITLTDERYGEPGHDDSNWQQLAACGFLGKEARLLPLLISDASLEDTVAAFDSLLAKELSINDVIIGLFGMGADGHIAGILPDSPAVSATGLAAGYRTPTFTRITTTFAALEHLTAGYLFAFGSEKLEALQSLQDTKPLNEQPAQILKSIPESYVYNDSLGE